MSRVLLIVMVCWSVLFVVCCVTCVNCRWLLFVVCCCLLFAAVCSLFDACRLYTGVCRLMFVVQCCLCFAVVGCCMVVV